MNVRQALSSFRVMTGFRASVLALCAGFCFTGSAQAAMIVWASGTADPAGADSGWVSLLEGAGHDVTRFTITGALTPENISQLNAADLVIVGRAVNSSHFDNANGQLWNEQVTSKVLAMSAYITRNNRMGWQTGNNVPDSGPTPLIAVDPAHPIFNGISFQGDGMTMTNDYNVMIDRGTTTIGDPLVAGATVIATNPSVANGIAIAEWPAGTVVTDDSIGAQTLAGPRVFFAGGSREVDQAALTTAGVMDLTADGQQLFLNTVNYAITIPEPSALALAGLGCSLLLRRASRRR